MNVYVYMCLCMYVFLLTCKCVYVNLISVCKYVFFVKVVLWITIEMTSCEIFMSMKITKHWLKVL